MLFFDESLVKNTKTLEFGNKKFAKYLENYRKQAYIAKTTSFSNEHSSYNSKSREFTSYDKLALAYFYIYLEINDIHLINLCKKHRNLSEIFPEILIKIQKTINSNNFITKINENFIKNNILPTLLKDHIFRSIIINQEFKPYLGDCVVQEYVASKCFPANRVPYHDINVNFNFSSSDYKLIIASFKNISSLIDEHLRNIDNLKNNTKVKSFDIDDLDALSKRLKKVATDYPRDIYAVFEKYSMSDYIVWNSLARGQIRLSRKAVSLIKNSSIQEIDVFLFNICCLDDMNAALKSGLVVACNSKKTDYAYLYRGVSMGGACSWFKISLPKVAKRNDIVMKTYFASEVRERIKRGNFIVVDPAPMSTSKSWSVACNFARKITGDWNGVIVHIKAPGNLFKGVDMSYRSYYNEGEVLLPAGVKLKITDCKYNSNVKYETVMGKNFKNDSQLVEVYADVVSNWSDLNEMYDDEYE